jgi:hypothetical protein
MVLRHQRLRREQGSGMGHGGDVGQPFDVDKASFPVWRREVGLPDNICYEVEGRLPDKQSTPKKVKSVVSQKASVDGGELACRIKQNSRSQYNPVASQSQKALMANQIVSQHQKVPMARLAAEFQYKKVPMAHKRPVPEVIVTPVPEVIVTPVSKTAAEFQHKKAPMAHKRPVPEVIVTPVPEVIVTPPSKKVAASSSHSKRRRLIHTESTAKSGDKQLVNSDPNGRGLVHLLDRLESEMTLIRRASSRVEELFDQIKCEIRTLH